MTHVRLLMETVTSLQVYMEPETRDCVNNILLNKKCNMIRKRRSNFFNYIFGADAHNEIRTLSSTVSKNFREVSNFAAKETNQLA